MAASQVPRASVPVLARSSCGAETATRVSPNEAGARKALRLLLCLRLASELGEDRVHEGLHPVARDEDERLAVRGPGRVGYAHPRPGSKGECPAPGCAGSRVRPR